MIQRWREYWAEVHTTRAINNAYWQTRVQIKELLGIQVMPTDSFPREPEPRPIPRDVTGYGVAKWWQDELDKAYPRSASGRRRTMRLRARYLVVARARSDRGAPLSDWRCATGECAWCRAVSDIQALAHTNSVAYPQA